MASSMVAALLVTLLVATTSAASAADADLLFLWQNEIATVNQAINLGNQLGNRYHGALALAQLKALQSAQRSKTLPKAAWPAVVAYAGYDFLSGVFPWKQSSRFDGLIADALAPLNLTDSVRIAAKKIGNKYANIQLTNLANDGFGKYANFKFPAAAPHIYQPTPGQIPPNKTRPTLAYPQLASVRPFVLTVAQSTAIANNYHPNELGTEAYNADLRYVQSVGELNSTTRTPYQSDTANFWADLGGTPGTSSIAGHWLNITFQAIPNDTTLYRAAEIVAATTVSAFDASITAWKVKWGRLSWRPVNAIRYGDADNAAVPDWLPFLVTPPHPEYVSGHQATVGGFLHALETLFPGNKSITVPTQSTAKSAVDGSSQIPPRTYANFREAADEVGRSREFAGLHFPKANNDGLLLGADASRLVLARLGIKAE